MQRHLQTLPILYYVYGGLIVTAATAGLLFVGLGVLVEHDASTNAGAPPPGWLPMLLKSFGWVLASVISVVGVLYILAGMWIAQRRRRTATIILAALACLSFPLGTVLGIYTLVVLNDEAVQEEYRALDGRVIR